MASMRHEGARIWDNTSEQMLQGDGRLFKTVAGSLAGF